ncbi:MAG: hypothetical protein ACLFUO_05045 [Candidatus Woesearchaeota archaeon]
MSSLTIEQLHEDMLGLKKEVKHLRKVIEEDYELADDVIDDIENSKSRDSKEMISHEEMRNEFA